MSGTASTGSCPRARISSASAINGLTSPKVPKVVKTIRIRGQASKYDGSRTLSQREVGLSNVNNQRLGVDSARCERSVQERDRLRTAFPIVGTNCEFLVQKLASKTLNRRSNS